ncbi:MAG: biotin/lipoyl-binding protein, partial [Candidatus Competibacteraceae bacterium]
MSEIIEIKVPDIGDFKGVEVIEVLVKPGDALALEDPMIMLESDKASMEVPASQTGTVKELKVKVGDKISEGDVILLLEAAATAPSPQPAPAKEEGAAPPAQSAPAKEEGAAPPAQPAPAK